MSKEVSFKSLRITLSEEALEKLAKLRRSGEFRSDSATIEECIRAVDCAITDVLSEFEAFSKLSEPNQTAALDTLTIDLLKIMTTRLSRFRKTYFNQMLAQKQSNRP